MRCSRISPSRPEARVPRPLAGLGPGCGPRRLEPRISHQPLVQVRCHRSCAVGPAWRCGERTEFRRRSSASAGRAASARAWRGSDFHAPPCLCGPSRARGGACPRPARPRRARRPRSGPPRCASGPRRRGGGPGCCRRRRRPARRAPCPVGGGADFVRRWTSRRRRCARALLRLSNEIGTPLGRFAPEDWRTDGWSGPEGARSVDPVGGPLLASPAPG